MAHAFKVSTVIHYFMLYNKLSNLTINSTAIYAAIHADRQFLTITFKISLRLNEVNFLELHLKIITCYH